MSAVFSGRYAALFFSNGRAVLYRTGGLLHWKTVSLNIIMKENDVIGCGFERNEDQSANGLVYFTCNGDRLAGDLDGVQSGLWPVIHIQKKVRNIQELHRELLGRYALRCAT